MRGKASHSARRRRKSTQLLAAAIAAIGGTCFVGLIGVSLSRASLTLDLRVAGINGVPVSGNRKAADLHVGDTLTLNVVGQISGTNSVQLTGNFDLAAPNTDTRNDDSLQS